MIDRKIFFDHARAEPFGGSMTTSQVTGLSNILDEAERRGIGDPRFLAYRLGTVFHETGRAMVPVREAGGEVYLKGKPYYPWVGMGLVQVTWEANGRKFGATKPEDLMAWPVALRALFDGMDQGVFTGRRLSTYFNDKIDDPIGARHIINGSDKAALIAGYHKAFLAAIKAGLAAAEKPSPTPELDTIRRAINAEAAKQSAAARPVVSASVPTAGPAHIDRQPGPPTGWRAVLASIKARLGRAA